MFFLFTSTTTETVNTYPFLMMNITETYTHVWLWNICLVLVICKDFDTLVAQYFPWEDIFDSVSSSKRNVRSHWPSNFYHRFSAPFFWNFACQTWYIFIFWLHKSGSRGRADYAHHILCAPRIFRPSKGLGLRWVWTLVYSQFKIWNNV